jgi:hypothetical protein
VAKELGPDDRAYPEGDPRVTDLWAKEARRVRTDYLTAQMRAAQLRERLSTQPRQSRLKLFLQEFLGIKR